MHSMIGNNKRFRKKFFLSKTVNAFRSAIAAAGLFAAASAVYLSPAHALDIDVTNFTLDNGMEVLVIPDRRAPIVTHMVWYRVGSADEPQGKSGIAHFLEHLMFKGTKKIPPGQFSRIIRKNGGQGNAFTSKDFTAYYQRIAKDRLDLVMGMEADRMINIQLKDSDVISERAVVQEERRSRIENEPGGLLSEQLNAALYVAHPYGKPVIGWMTEVQKLTREDSLSFYRRFYTPRNAILIVAGDVGPDEVRALAEKHYGSIANTDTADKGSRQRAEEPVSPASKRVEMRDHRVANPTFQRIYLTPSYATDEPREAEALEILSRIMSSVTGRLYKQLVVEKKLVPYAGSSFTGDGLDSGTLVVFAAAESKERLLEAEREIDILIEDIVQNGVTEEEVARAKKALIAQTVYALDSQFQLAFVFGSALTTGQTVSDVLGWTKRLESVTAEDVRKVAAKFLRKENSATGILLPEKRKEASAAGAVAQ